MYNLFQQVKDILHPIYGIKKLSLVWNDLFLCQEDEKEDIMDCYYNALHAPGAAKLYRKISEHFCGIRLEDVQSFANKRSGHGNVRHPDKVKLQPMFCQRPFARQQVDVVDVSWVKQEESETNDNMEEEDHRYVLAVLDVFTR